jgi:plasmid stabilization system protein ParE
MLHRIVITKRAYAQFQSICEYLVDEFGERIADNFEFEVEQCVATLMKFPHAQGDRFCFNLQTKGKKNRTF